MKSSALSHRPSPGEPSRAWMVERRVLAYAVFLAALVGFLLGLLVHLQPEGASRAGWPDPSGVKGTP